jgi:hypothetical protein
VEKTISGFRNRQFEAKKFYKKIEKEKPGSTSTTFISASKVLR